MNTMKTGEPKGERRDVRHPTVMAVAIRRERSQAAVERRYQRANIREVILDGCWAPFEGGDNAMKEG